MNYNEAIERIARYVGNDNYTREHQEACKMAIAALKAQAHPTSSWDQNVSHSTKVCPRCEGDTSVVNCRMNGQGMVKRDRKCLCCGYRYQTLETLYYDAPREARE